MKIEETFNIHKKINCVFPFFKSKWLCKKGLHNYHIRQTVLFTSQKSLDESWHRINYITKWHSYWECECCGKIKEFEE